MKVGGRIAAAVLSACSLLLVAAADEEPPGRSLEAQVLAQINHARQNPRDYARELREYRRYFEGDLLFLPGDDNGVQTREGTDAVDEAIDFLERQAPLPPLGRGDVLALAALDHADAQGEEGATGHVSRAGASPGARVRSRGGDIYVGESISYGHDRADAVVRQMIVDDGVPGRGHRKLLFSRDFRFAGVGCGDHRRWGHMCVVDLSATDDGTPALPQWAKAQGSRPARVSAAR
jgi:uncharacterized protein YkwD